MSEHDDPKPADTPEHAPGDSPPPAPEPPPDADPGATVAWDPAEIPGLGDRAGAGPGGDPAGAPGADPGATMAWDPEELKRAAEAEATQPGAAESNVAGDADASEEDPLVGTVLRGKWRVHKRLGAGAFGTVYQVEDIAGGWMEALKILSVDKLTGAEGEAMKKRFLREAQIMKRLGKESKHIVGLSTYEDDFEAGLIYLVMEYVEGRPLSEVLAEEGPFPVDRVIDIALQVCDALIAAHAEPVVHRDLKLENLMMTVDNKGNSIVKVLDFGIAKIAEKETDSRLTTVGTLGTPGYAAPEQLRAEPVDARTDLFAFGVILYELLTGQDPWLGNPAHTSTTQIYDLMVLAERGEVRPFSETGVDVPPAMQNIVMKLLRREPEQRFQSAEELRDALLRVREGAAVGEDVASLRVLTDEPGVRVEIRSGRQVVAEGPTPCVANALSAGTYRVRVVDPRYEPLETTVTLDAGAVEDLTVVAQPRATGLGATVRRRSGLVAAVVALIALGAAAAVLQPWGRTLTVEELEARADAVQSAWVTEAGIAGNLRLGPIATPFTVPLPDEGKSAAVERLRAAGLPVDASWEVSRLLELARAAQERFRYYGGTGDDVVSYAQRILELDPENAEARSLLRKVAERMAWDADAARAEGGTDRAAELLSRCLELVPGHPRCTAVAGGG